MMVTRHYYSSIIFSRYPLLIPAVRFPRPTLPDVLMYADIKKGDDTYGVYIHTSNRTGWVNMIADRIPRSKQGKTAWWPIQKVYWARSERIFPAEAYRRKWCMRSWQPPRPYLLCIDMNDVPNSYAYETVRGGLVGCLFEEGFGIGCTPLRGFRPHFVLIIFLLTNISG